MGYSPVGFCFLSSTCAWDVTTFL
uniref:Uncharacterized protein n=1 Tax=Anguilla anguilla TaxID=7936 RepID=A0A0E9R7P0_ANGAN